MERICLFLCASAYREGFTHGVPVLVVALVVVVAAVEVTSSEVDDNESSDSDDVVCRCWWNWQNTNMTYES